MMERGSASHTEKNDIHKAITEGGTASHRKLGQLNNIKNNNNDILYSCQQNFLREIKAVVQSHNEEHLSIIISH